MHKLPANTTGITSVTRGSVDLTVPPDTPPGAVWRYGLGFPFQVAPGRGGIFVDVHIECTPTYGFQNGTDVVLFDDLSCIQADQATPITRNEYPANAETGEPRLLVRSPLTGGFVPLGARGSNGSEHPGAGTGFGLGPAHLFPMNEKGGFRWGDRKVRHTLEVYQFCYDGRKFQSTRSAVTHDPESPLKIGDSDWCIILHGMTTPIPDGDDLLMAVVARTDAAVSAGVSRWAIRDGLWRPISFDPVTEGDTGEAWKDRSNQSDVQSCRWIEPSLIRDTDGGLLYSARGHDEAKTSKNEPLGNLIQVWRSTGGGSTWETIVTVLQARFQAPVTLNHAADGTPYIVSNPFDPHFVRSPKTGRGRERLCLWPLNADRSDLGIPITIRDAVTDFPALPANPDWFECWMADHPNAATLQLSDGKWHSVLAYRVLHSPLYHSLGTYPAPQSGCYIEEVLSKGPEMALWDF